MVVDELFKRLEKKTERDLLNQTTQTVFRAQTQALTSVNNPKTLLKKIKIAGEVLWFFAALAIGFLIGCVFYEIFSIWIPDGKKVLISLLFEKDSNFFYFLSAISVLGVYISRLTIWALKLIQP